MRKAAAYLSAASQDWAERMLEQVLAGVPALGRDEETRSVALAMAKANIDAFAEVLQHEIPPDAIEAPWITTRYVRRLAWEGLAIDDVIRGYRLGQEWVFGQLTEFVTDEVKDPELAFRLLAHVGALSFRYVDVVCTRVAAEFADERGALVRGALARRADVVRSLLAGETVDVEAAERTLNYRLDGRHVAVLVWDRETAESSASLESLDAAAGAVSEALGCEAPLILHDGPALVATWAAVPSSELIRWAAVESAADEAGVRVAAGRPAHGLEGFRETRRQAERARSVALAGDHDQGLVRYDATALVSLLLADRTAAQAFVAEELGPLAAEGELEATLRETLRVLLQSGGVSEAAHELFLHRNTVAQRVRKAEALLGRPLGERRQETEAALLVREWLGS